MSEIKHVTPAVAADMLGCSTDYVADLFDAGHLKGYRLPIGRKERRILVSSIVELACPPQPDKPVDPPVPE